MLKKSRELIFAAIAMVFITLAYLLIQIVYREVPSASSLWGHSIGVLGFALMLMTEVLYSLRKRSNRARWGRMSDWLEFHIFTGLVGPFLVLLHPGWQFKGLAGVLSLLTLLIVVSGFIGRYIYTAVPRTADGVEIDLEELERQAAAVEAELEVLSLHEATQPNPARRMAFGSLVTAWSIPFGLVGVLERNRIRHSRLAARYGHENGVWPVWNTSGNSYAESFASAKRPADCFRCGIPFIFRWV